MEIDETGPVIEVGINLALGELTISHFQRLTDRDLERLARGIAYVNSFRRHYEKHQYKIKLPSGSHGGKFEMRRITQVGLSFVDIPASEKGGVTYVDLQDGDVIYKKHIDERFGDTYRLIWRGHQLDIFDGPLENSCHQCRYNTLTRFVSGEDRAWILEMLFALSDEDFDCPSVREELIAWIVDRRTWEDGVRSKP